MILFIILFNVYFKECHRKTALKSTVTVLGNFIIKRNKFQFKFAASKKELILSQFRLQFHSKFIQVVLGTFF